MRTHVKPLIIAIVALLVLAGGSAAASRYIITSTKQIKPSVLKSLKGNRGPQGPKGTPGPAGPQGPRGPAGVAHIDTQTSAEQFVCSDNSCGYEAVATAYCPAGEIPLSGGYIEDPNRTHFFTDVLASLPVSDATGNGWSVDIVDISPSATTGQGGLFAKVTCAGGIG